MRVKEACLVVDLRSGQHIASIPDLAAVLWAAGWKVDIALKVYGGETIALARKAAKEQYDLVLGYGGDGTLNALLNGVMYAHGKSVVADIPGGTFNVWASAIDIPNDPVKAALAIVASEARMLDLGHVEVEGLSLGNDAENDQLPVEKKAKKPRQSTSTRQYFLLNVGIGMDAVMMAHISKPLKYQFGSLAFDVATVKELPHQRPFPVEVQQTDDSGNVEEHWQGEVWQIYVSKVPLFGGSINLDPGSRADDGLLYVALVTANGPLKTLEQAFTLITQHKLDKETTRYMRGRHFSVRVPASMTMHVDGSIVELEELLHKAESSALQQAGNAEQVMVTYRFDIEPNALQMAVPRTYNGPLFKNGAYKEDHQEQQREDEAQHMEGATKEKPQSAQKTSEQRKAYKMTVIGSVVVREKQHVYIVAGRIRKQDTDESQVVAVRVDDKTQVLNEAGERVAPTTVLELQEGQEVVAEGNKTKHGVIRAVSMRLSA